MPTAPFGAQAPAPAAQQWPGQPTAWPQGQPGAWYAGQPAYPGYGQPPVPPKKSKAALWIIIVAIIVVIALVIGAYFMFFRGKSGPGGSNAPVVPITPGAQAYGGTDVDCFYSVAVGVDSTIMAVGYTKSTDGTFPVTHSGEDAVAMKVNPDGTTAWAKTFGGSDDDEFYSVAAAPDGTFIAVGMTLSRDGDFPITHQQQDAVLAKINPDGTLAWAKTFGGDDYEAFNDVRVASDGSIYVSGWTYSSDGDFPAKYPGGEDALAAKFSSSGDMQWAKVFGGSDNEFFSGVALAPNGNVVLAGSTSSSDGDFPSTLSGSYDGVVATLNPADGSLVWLKTFGGNGDDEFEGVIVGQDGTAYATGFTDSTSGAIASTTDYMAGVVAAVDTSGTMQWVKVFAGDDDTRFNAIDSADGGNIVAVGYTLASSDVSLGTASSNATLGTSLGMRDALAINMSPDGTVNWAQRYGGSDYDLFWDVAGARDGSLVYAGTTYSTDGDFPSSHGTDVQDAALARATAKGKLS